MASFRLKQIAEDDISKFLFADSKSGSEYKDSTIKLKKILRCIYAAKALCPNNNYTAKEFSRK
jgi:hypothetical protein